jgi:L-lactate dehydrogenase complex protein LldG
MSTRFDSFEQSLTKVDVECAHVGPEEVADAVTDFVSEPAVGVPLHRDDIGLPPGVTVDPTPAELKRAVTGVTPAAFAIADYGSLVLPSTDEGSELVSLYVDRHVAVLDERDIVPTMEAAFERFDDAIGAGVDDAILATGPSATADMGALVKGAHGPSQVYVTVVEES